METRSKSRREEMGDQPKSLPSNIDSSTLQPTERAGECQGDTTQALPNPSMANNSPCSVGGGMATQILEQTKPPTSLLSKAFSLISKGGETMLNSFQKSPPTETQTSRATMSLPSQFLDSSGKSGKVSSKQSLGDHIAPSGRPRNKDVVLASPLSSSSPKRPVSVIGRIFQRNKFPTASSSSYVPNTTANTYLPESPQEQHDQEQQIVLQADARHRLAPAESFQPSLEWGNNDIVIEDDVFNDSFSSSDKVNKHELLVSFKMKIDELYEGIENPTLVANISTFKILEQLSDLQDWVGKLPLHMNAEDKKVVDALEDKIPKLIEFFLSVHKNESSSNRSSEVRFNFGIPKSHDQEHFHSFSSPPLDNTVPINKDNESNLETHDSPPIVNSDCHAQFSQPSSTQEYHPEDDRKWFVDELVKYRKTCEDKISSLRSDWKKDLSNFSNYLDSKLEKTVQEKVSHESNMIRIKCIESKNEMRKSLLGFQEAVVEEFKVLHENNRIFKNSLEHLSNQVLELRSDLLTHTKDSYPSTQHSGITSDNIVDDNNESSKDYDPKVTPSVAKPSIPKTIFSPVQHDFISVQDSVDSFDHNSSLSTKDSSRLMSNRSRLSRKIQFCCQQINEIVQEEVNNTTSRARVIEIQSFELVTLRGLKKELDDYEIRAEKIGLEKCIEQIDRTQEKIKLWELSVTRQRKANHLHLSSEKSLLKSVNLPKFDASPYGQTVYTFLATFFRFAEKACSPADQALLIYTTYLSDPIKREVESFQDSIDKIKDYLIDRYGDLRTIAESRLQAIATLKHPSSSDHLQIDYYKKVYQCLLQVESLCQADLINKNDLNSVIFTSTYVKQLVSHMPEPIIDTFSERIEKEKSIDKSKGEFHFFVLKDIIDHKWKKLSTKSSIRSLREGTGNSKSKTVNVVEASETSTHAVNTSNRSFVFPCPFHKDKHELGCCEDFMSSSNKERRRLCVENKICWLCFRINCFKSNKGKCVSIASLPKGFVCSDCQTSKLKPLNVLTCNWDHKKSSSAEIERVTRSYLKIVDTDLLSKLTMSFNAVVFNKVNSTDSSRVVPKSKSSFDASMQVPSFDTSTGKTVNPESTRYESSNESVYILQTLLIGGQQGICFYDSGASGNLVRGAFAESAGFKTIDPENQRISGVANVSMWTNYGIYSCQLGPDRNGDWWQLAFQGIDKITSPIPKYPWAEINKEAVEFNLVSETEYLPPFVGGREVDMILGLKTPELMPVLEFSVPSGLGCYRCPFQDIHGSTLAYGGAHHIISTINKTYGHVSVNQLAILLTQTVNAYQGSPWMILSEHPLPKKPLTVQMSNSMSHSYETTPLSDQEIDLLDPKSKEKTSYVLDPSCTHTPKHICSTQLKAKVPLAKLRQLLDHEEPLVSYRCEECEACRKCLGSPTLKSASVRERQEMKLIKSSIRIDYLQRKVFICLPFTVDIDHFLTQHFRGKSSNIDQALAVYRQQTRKSEDMKEKIRNAMNQLIELNFIEKLEDSDPEIVDIVNKAPVTHFHIWRPVFKDSISTPVRLIVDPSSTMLNLAIAKSESGLNSMFSILLRFRSSKEVWSSDVSKLYNQLHLDPSCAPYSLFVYHPNLDENTPPDKFRMCRGWYGISSTGPQAAETLKRAGEDHAESHPLGSEALSNDLFVDDLNPGQDSIALCKEQVREVKEILTNIGLDLKYVAYSKEDPPPEASKNGISMSVLGMAWFPKADRIGLNLPEVNFSVKKRGEKAPNAIPADSDDKVKNLCDSLAVMTRKHVASKLGEFFDITGCAEPVKAFYKRSAARLNHLDFKDPIPDEEREFWTRQFMLWPDFLKITFPRTTIPDDACLPLEARLIVCSDASDQCGGAAVYESYLTKAGNWSVRLLTAKSQLLRMSIPRNELHSLVLAAELCYSVVVSLQKKKFKDVLFITDSLVTLCWVSNENARNKVYVSNSVLTIRRYFDWIRKVCGEGTRVDLAHCKGTLNPADFLTKGNIGPKDISENSKWYSGFDWMSKNISEMDLTRFKDVSLSKSEISSYLDEVALADLDFIRNDGKDQTNYMIYNDHSYASTKVMCVIAPSSSAEVKSYPVNCYASQHNSKQPYLVDVVYQGWQKGNSVLKLCTKFCLKLFHQTHINTRNIGVKVTMSLRCKICILDSKTVGQMDDPIFRFTGLSETDIVSFLPQSSEKGIPSAEDLFSDSTVVGSEGISDINNNTDPKNKESQIDSVEIIVADDSITHIANIEAIVETILDTYWDKTATRECLEKLTSKELTHYEISNNVLFYKGRVSNEQSVSVHDLDMIELEWLGSKQLSFHSPCVLSTSDIFYSYCIYVHFNLSIHGGVEATYLEIQKRFHVINGRKMIAALIKDCIKCKIIRKKTLNQAMKNHSSLRLTFAPAFFIVMIDLAQDFLTKTRFQSRGKDTMRCPALVIVCVVTGSTNVLMCENWSTQSVILALTRHSNRYGAPKILIVDQGSQLKKLKEVSFNLNSFVNAASSKVSCQVIVSAAKHHQSQGKVERRICLVKDLIAKLGKGNSLMSFLSWETLFSQISNHLNSLPICRSSARSVNSPEFTVITPNLLLCGFNSKRSLAGPLFLDTAPTAIIDKIATIQDTFFSLLAKQLHLLVPRPKWFEDSMVEIGDVILFYTSENVFHARSIPWKYGLVKAISGSRLTIEYTIGDSFTKKTIERNKKQVVRIAHESELDFNSDKHKERLIENVV